MKENSRPFLCVTEYFGDGQPQSHKGGLKKTLIAAGRLYF